MAIGAIKPLHWPRRTPAPSGCRGPMPGARELAQSSIRTLGSLMRKLSRSRSQPLRSATNLSGELLRRLFSERPIADSGGGGD